MKIRVEMRGLPRESISRITAFALNRFSRLTRRIFDFEKLTLILRFLLAAIVNFFAPSVTSLRLCLLTGSAVVMLRRPLHFSLPRR